MEELPFIYLNEEDFRLAIFEQLNGPIRYDPDRLANLRFNPLLSETYKKFSLRSHHDPDANFFTELVDCEYYTEENFNEMFASEKIYYRSIIVYRFCILIFVAFIVIWIV